MKNEKPTSIPLRCFVKFFYLCNMKQNSTILIILLFLLATYSIQSQSIVSIDLLKNSTLVVNGSTNLMTFQLIQNGDKLLRKTQTLIAMQNKNKIYLSENKLSISVKNFSSNNIIALDGFLHLLKVETYPFLNVEFNHIETPTLEKENYFKTKTLVSFTITGVTKQYTIPITATQNGDQYIITGNKSINIRDFGLEPPIRMMGLVKVSEWINISFQLICNVTIKKSIAEPTALE